MQIIGFDQIIRAVIMAYQIFLQVINIFIDALWQNIASAIVDIITTDSKLTLALTLIGSIAILIRIAKNKPTWIIGSIIR